MKKSRDEFEDVGASLPLEGTEFSGRLPAMKTLHGRRRDDPKTPSVAWSVIPPDRTCSDVLVNRSKGRER